MEIGRLTEDDLPFLAELYKQFWGEESSLKRMRATFQRLSIDPDYVFWVAKINNRVVGSVMGIVCEELYGECKPFLVVEDVLVDQNHRRKGIGASLMRQLERCAADRGCGYIIFVTEKERTDAHRFYESLGYKAEAYKGFKKRLPTNH